MYFPSNLEEQINLQQRLEYTGTNVTYIGFAPPEAAESDSMWLIKKYVYDGSDQVIKITLADKSKAFDKRWDNRTAYAY